MAIRQRNSHHKLKKSKRGNHFTLGLWAGIVLITFVALASGCTQAAQTAVSQPMSTSTPITVLAAQEETATAAPTNTPQPTLTTLPTVTNTTTPPPPTETAVPTIPPTATIPPPLPTPQGVYSWTLKVPILMYHYISEPPQDADKYRKDLSITPADFRTQMAYLAANGYETVDLYDLTLAITAKKDLPEKPVIITLDDGYRDNYENAFPILQENGQKATFFIVTEFIDNGYSDYMTWEMAEEMAAAGMRIEPHSKTHADLTGREHDYLIYEILGSQETIAAHIGYTPRYFCYPGGRYDDATIEVVSELNFWGAVTTEGGQWHGFDNRFEWPRMRMRHTTALPEFADFVNPGATVAGKSDEG